MVFNTLTVGAAVTPAVIETAFSHYLNRKPLHEKPTAHISYHEGLGLVRQFLSYAANHTVDDLQAFTAQWVPSPRWVKVDEIAIPEAALSKSADLLHLQLGHRGIDKIGGKTWWQWRQDGPLKAEWIEMRKDFHERKAIGDDLGQRIMLYVHGGAYYFGSVDEHRYQMQRHARKLKARVLAPKYRLAPQFPFPCGLYDCIAAYLYLLEQHDPSTIILAGDSAGGGMVVSMLVILRDQGIALPAGAILISPWVDLTHSFPSVAGDGSLDYIPAYGFHHRPSMAWPPPNSQDMQNIARSAVEALVDVEKKEAHSHGKDKHKKQTEHERKVEQEEQEAIQGFAVDEHPGNRNEYANKNNPASPSNPDARGGDTIPGPGHDLSIMLDGKLVEIIDQIQMYATNQLLAHPLVSPVLQPSLGGLPPLLIQTGGGELLRDEQIYLAHKAANPSLYAPSNAFMDEHDPKREILNRYPPTEVQLQVWEDLCHVAHTLSFTRPAKYMYRGVAQFGAWAYSRAQKKTNAPLEDDVVSIISGTSGGTSPSSSTTDLKDVSRNPSAADGTLPHPNGENAPCPDRKTRTSTTTPAPDAVGRAGDSLPPFKNHMIRQRVTRHGLIFPLAPVSEISALQLDPSSIGVIKQGPVRKWLSRKADWDHKFAREKRSVQKQRIKEMAQGYDVIGDEETPPPTALAGRRRKDMPKTKARKGKSWGLAMWSGWGSKHDESTIEAGEKVGGKERRRSSGFKREKAAEIQESRQDKAPNRSDVSGNSEKAHTDNLAATTATTAPVVITEEQLRKSITATSSQAPLLSEPQKPEPTAKPSAPIPSGGAEESQKVPGSENTYLNPQSSRPHNGTVAYPFKLRNTLERNASTFTLDSQTHDSAEQVAPMRDLDVEASRVDGLDSKAASGGGHGEAGGSLRDDRRLAGAQDERVGAGAAATAPAVGNRTETAARPPLETFVTAQEF